MLAVSRKVTVGARSLWDAHQLRKGRDRALYGALIGLFRSDSAIAQARLGCQDILDVSG